jgi:hypothetical protein
MLGYDFIPFIPYEGENSGPLGHYLNFRMLPKENIDLKPLVRLGFGSYRTSDLYHSIKTKFYLASGGLLLSLRYSSNIRFNFSFTGGVSVSEKTFGNYSTGFITICSSIELTAYEDSRLHFEIYGPSFTTLEGGPSFGIIGVIIGYKFD